MSNASGMESGHGPGPSIVGIGASAGGLDAMKDFFSALPADSGLTFVVVQHLDPSHESHTAEILSKVTPIRIVAAEDGMRIEPNTAYTNSPGRTLLVRGGRLVQGESSQGEHVETVIDHFLSSLADEAGARAVGIILSGSNGADSPRGIRAIRAAGGMCMVQDPGTAQFPAMPQAIIDTGLADSILAPAEMPAALVAFAHHLQGPAADPDAGPAGAEAGDFETILGLLHTHSNSDFRCYKQPMVFRRIQRRMGLRQVHSLGDYVQLLRNDPGELARLSRDMLIGVSSFFRDTETFERLRTEIIAPLVQSKANGAPLRAWVAGCATGEEAYSIAMLLLEAVVAAGKACPVQVFATDVDARAVETARAGVYPSSIAADVPAGRLERFFVAHGQTYRVTKTLREAVIFSKHDLLSDPPFPRLDLVSCRNVLIYIDPAAQKKLLAVFGFALNVGGTLMLGRSEGVGGMEAWFEPISKSDRLYRLTRSGRKAGIQLPVYRPERAPGPIDREPVAGNAASLPQANLDAVLGHFDASVVLIDGKGEIVYFRGHTEKYLSHPKGPASLNILNMTAGSLSTKLRSAIDTAQQQDAPIRLQGVTLPGTRSRADLTVMRVGDRASGGRLLAVIFEDTSPAHASTRVSPPAADDEPLVSQLEAEVKTLRTELQTNAEESDSANEELKAASEEVMSMNEELQSANEELEAAKEELQSLNEELTTVNAQLSDNVGELTRINDDLANLLVATDIATVFLDPRLQIRRFTPRATQLLNLIPTDIGRPLAHITTNFTGVDLPSDASGVIKTLSPVEREIRARDGSWYVVRVLPYRTQDNRIDGAVITFSDVSGLKETAKYLRYERTYAERVTETVRHPLLVLDETLQVLSANRAFYETFQVKPNQTVGSPLYALGNMQWDVPELRALLVDLLDHDAGFEDFAVEHDFPAIGHRVMLLSGRRIEPTEDMPERVLLTIEDVSRREKDRALLESLNANLEQRVTDRTALAENRAGQLRALASELAHTEHRERERLARVLHDDLQQLLVGAKLQLSNLRSHAQDPAQLEAVDKVDDLLKQSLEASRSLTVELSPTILYEMGLDAALLWLVRQVKAKHGLDVTTEINARVGPDDQGVGILLYSAVSELLLNIVKHAGVKTAFLRLDRDEGGEIRITVSDRGAGFDTGKPQSGETHVTGLGLFGLQQRFEYIGGRCEIASIPGSGTNVTLTAKLAPVGAVAHRKPQRFPVAATAGAASPGSPTRVLLVDDHAIVRQGLAGLLNDEPDIEVVAEACDGEQAIEQARLHRPEVVIMDVSMPGMNGIDATRKILAELPATRIIGLSMYTEADRAEAMRQAGAVAYVSKGGPSDDLLQAVRKVS